MTSQSRSVALRALPACYILSKLDNSAVTNRNTSLERSFCDVDIDRKDTYLEVFDKPIILAPDLGGTVKDKVIEFGGQADDVHGSDIEAVEHVPIIIRHAEA